MKTTNIKTIIKSLEILVKDIQIEIDIANACIAEASKKIEELLSKLQIAKDELNKIKDKDIQ